MANFNNNFREDVAYYLANGGLDAHDEALLDFLAGVEPFDEAAYMEWLERNVDYDLRFILYLVQDPEGGYVASSFGRSEYRDWKRLA